MRILNDSKLAFAPFLQLVDFPRHWLALIVKGTFDLQPGDAAQPAEEQLWPAGDEPYEDAEANGSVRYESDFAFFKPNADLLLAGKCHAPDGEPVPNCPVTFQVGSHAKTLEVFGNRFLKGWLSVTVSEPQPFTEMELRYENSYGGPGYAANPVGKGHDAVADEEGHKQRPLPNIQSLDAGSSRKQATDGFGPLGKDWKDRKSKIGTYKTKWLKERWPALPDDFDMSFFNAAPPEMQVEGYLKGDEEIYLQNLHPDHSEYRSRLPRLRVRCFLNEIHVSDKQPTDIGLLAEGRLFREVPLNLDTLWIDAEAEQLVLVWRGADEVLTDDYEEIEHVYIMSEPVDDPPQSLEMCRTLFQQAVAAEDAKFAEPEELADEEPAEAVAAPESAEEVDPAHEVKMAELDAEQAELDGQIAEKETELAKYQEGSDDALRKQGIDPENPKFAEERVNALLGRLDGLDQMDEGQLKAFAAEMDAEVMTAQKKLAEIKTQAGSGFENVPGLTAEQKQRLQTLSGELEAPPEPEPPPAAAAEDVEIPAVTAESTGWTREAVEQWAAAGESMSGEDLSGLDLSELDLHGVDFSGAILAGAVLTKADLSKADLTSANLAEANLAEANLQSALLKGADLADTDLSGADLTQALLTDANLENAQLVEATLEQAAADGARFSSANLTGAAMRGASFAGADFSSSVLDQADLSGSDLTEASFAKGSAIKADFSWTNLTKIRGAAGTDFTRASFRQAVGPGSIWEKAVLVEADFSYADLSHANFTKANLQRANLHAANMKFARLRKADLREATMTEMNLFSGNLEQADLTDADLSGSNMYGVEFWQAEIAGIKTDDTNLKMSKLGEGLEHLCRNSTNT